MKKLKIYLDTSVISHLKQDDAPERTAETFKLWQDIKAGKYDVYLSDITLQEVYRCRQPKQDLMVEFLALIDYTVISESNEIVEIAEEIIEMKILTRKSLDDCMHIAAAIVSGCDYIVSWNFKHLVNIKTINGIRAVTALKHYKSIDIVQPTLLIQSEEE